MQRQSSKDDDSALDSDKNAGDDAACAAARAPPLPPPVRRCEHDTAIAPRALPAFNLNSHDSERSDKHERTLRTSDGSSSAPARRISHLLFACGCLCACSAPPASRLVAGASDTSLAASHPSSDPSDVQVACGASLASARSPPSRGSALSSARCSSCHDEIGDAASEGPWSCATCKFVNVHSVSRCMECGSGKDEQPQFCSEACEQQHQRELGENGNGASMHDSWLDRFTSACSMAPSYAHSFHAAVWFDSANQPCVSCRSCGATIQLSPSMMALIHEKIAEQRQSKNSAKSSASAGHEQEPQRSAEALAVHLGAASSSAPAPTPALMVEAATSPKQPNPTRLVPLVQARVSGISCEEKKHDAPTAAAAAEMAPASDFTVQLEPMAAPATVDPTIKSPDSQLLPIQSTPVARPPTPFPFSSAEAPSVTTTLSSLSDDEAIMPASMRSLELELPSRQAASRLSHPLFVQTKQLELSQPILPSPPSPSTFTQDQDRLLRQAHSTAGPWDGQLHCTQCGRSFAFTELQ